MRTGNPAMTVVTALVTVAELAAAAFALALVRPCGGVSARTRLPSLGRLGTAGL